jgi:hypothetical protein
VVILIGADMHHPFPGALVIRAPQMAALEQASLLEFVLRHASVAGQVDRERLRQLAPAYIAQAAGYRILLPDDVARFVGLVLALGPESDTALAAGWIGDLLRHPLLTGSGKIRQIEAGLARAAP